MSSEVNVNSNMLTWAIARVGYKIRLRTSKIEVRNDVTKNIKAKPIEQLKERGF